MSDSRARRFLRAGLTVAIVWLAVEGASAVVIGVGSGDWFSTGALQQARMERLAGGESANTGRAPAPRWVQSTAIHPYVGFVEDPSISAYEITDFGYYESDRPLYRRSPDKLIVGVFGGSFAYQFREEALELFVDRLGQDSRFAGREIIVTSTALPGYKQPQQLMSLNYLLALGGEFDVVLNIDGFNEVALYDAENRTSGVFPAYPRSWYYHAMGIGDAGLVEREAELIRLRRRIADGAAFHAAAPWRHSFAFNLAWMLRDRSRRNQWIEAQQRLLQYETTERRYVATGPAFDASSDESVYAMLTGLWMQSSLQMARLCAANGIVYVHALQPNQYLDGSKPFSAEERRSAVRANHPYRKGVVTGYPRLIDAGHQLIAAGVQFLDLTGSYSDVTDTLYVDDCCHVNRAGYERLVAPLVREIAADYDRIDRVAVHAARRNDES